jgi:lactoylglutathione lyase
MSTQPVPARQDVKGFPAPSEGFVLTHMLIVTDQDRSREFYRTVLGAEVLWERDPVVLRAGNSWLILDSGGGPSPDKPDIIAAPPQSSHEFASALNIRVPDVQAVYRQWRARGAEFLTEPKDLGPETRCSLRDPDGHLIEIGQSTKIREQQ